MTPINHERPAVHTATLPSESLHNRRSMLMAGAGAGVSLLFGTRRILAAPVEPAAEELEDPWESGACEVPEQDDGGADANQQSGGEAGEDDEVILPVRLLIPGIDVEARVEVLEIVGDTLQDPTNGEDVAWYKETGRPGEEGNAVIAGHLNWYNMPEGVFFAIDQLREGDQVLVRDTACREFRYLVEWVELVEVANADMEEITGPSEQAQLTLITCGGSWDPVISQYRERTVVRARLDGEPLPLSSDEESDDERDETGDAADEDQFDDGEDDGHDNDLGDAAGSDDDPGNADAGNGDDHSPQIVPRD